MKKAYQVRCEVNDHGWNHGYYLYENAKDARRSMRDYVAGRIRQARFDKKEVKSVIHFKDHVMDDPGTETECIFLRIDKDRYEFRIWAMELRDKPLERNRCFNF